MTKYVPVKDANGRVSAILFVGFDLTAALESLAQSVARIRFAEQDVVRHELVRRIVGAYDAEDRRSQIRS